MAHVSKYKDKEFLGKYREKVAAHKLNPFPQIIDALGTIRNKEILDIGCGSGELTLELAKRGAKTVGIDVSNEWIESCIEKYAAQKNLSFVQKDATKLPFRSGAFDAVVMNMVLLNVEPLSNVQKILSEVSRVLKREGVLIFSELHPILIMTAEVLNRTQKYPPGFSYFKDGARMIAQVRLESGEVLEFRNRHWTLETYTKMLEKAGLGIYRIIEPNYPKNAPANLRAYKIPEYILFSCKKTR